MKTKTQYTKTVTRLMTEHGIVPTQRPVLAALIAFAHNTVKFNPVDYGYDRTIKGTWREAMRLMNSDKRAVAEQLRRFKAALDDAIREGVTEETLIRIGKDKTNNTRMEWEEYPDSGWTYCAGQNYPTEFRGGACRILEKAVMQTCQARPEQVRKVNTIEELAALNKANGMCWFSPGSMRSFGTRICGDVINGRYFITSEPRPTDEGRCRRYTIREFDDKGNIRNASELWAYASAASAMRNIPKAQVETLNA